MKFYSDLLPGCAAEEANILRQALAGMIWSKQFFHYDVAKWLDGDALPPPDSRKWGSNRAWRHMKAQHVISMPDKWEYPWFAAWDLAFHCAALALVDVDFAKDQIELLLKADYLHPNGQIPAYEWAFGDVNPPVLAMAALIVFDWLWAYLTFRSGTRLITAARENKSASSTTAAPTLVTEVAPRVQYG